MTNIFRNAGANNHLPEYKELMQMIKVMIADDQEMIRQSLEVMINNNHDMKVVGAAEDGKMVIDTIKTIKPDILLLDIRMPHMDGVECMKIIREKNIQTKVIILTTFDDDEYIFEALKNGASGYLLKGISLEELAKSIRIVAKGGTLLNPDVATKLCRLFSKLAQADYVNKVEEASVDDLTPSEIKVLQLVGKGMSNKSITNELHISEGTVRNYISSILNKLNLQSRTQLAIYAVQSGLVTSCE